MPDRQRPFDASAIEAIIFDVGRTLYEGKARRRVAPGYTRRAFEALGLSHEGLSDAQITAAYLEATRVVRARHAQSYFRKGGSGPDRTLWLEHNAEVVARLGVEHAELSEEIERQWDGWAPVLKPQPATHETLDALQARGYRLGVFSNTFRDHRERFTKDGLLGYFEAFLLSFELGVWKPSPEAFTRSCEAMGLSPERTVYVGDKWQVDVLPALDAGMGAVFFESRERWPEDADAPSEVRMIDRFADLLSLFPGRPDAA